MNIDEIFYSSPSGISAEDLNHFSTIQTIDHLFRFFSFSLVAKLATIFRIKSPVPKF